MRAAMAEMIDDAGPAAPWLVMVHGMAQDARAFSAQVPAFRDRFRLLAIDLPGHGRSSEMAGPYGHGELADAVDGALDAAGVTRCHFWGTHTGTAIGLLLASRSPARFASLILEGAVLPGRTMPSVVEMFARVQAAAQRDGMAAARRLWLDEAGWYSVMRRQPEACRLAAHWEMITGFTGRPWLEVGQPAAVELDDHVLAHIGTPTLIYNGVHDLPDFLDVASKLEGLLARCQRTLIADAGGFPAWEFPARVNSEVAAFLTSTINNEEHDNG